MLPLKELLNPTSMRLLQDELNKGFAERLFPLSFFIVKLDYTNNQEELSIHPLRSYETLSSQKIGQNKLFFAFLDPSADLKYPGWPLRNLLSLISVRFALDQVSIIRIRRSSPNPKSETELESSKVLSVRLELKQSYNVLNSTVSLERPPCSGWEKNESQQLAPKRVNLSGLLDPKRLAADAVNLNLKLMKWRLVPGLDLEQIANSKCLILGCGTLGCHVARGLLAWGIREISLLDNSRVSYSNPVRQTLYTFDDCSTSGGIFKANAAAKSIRQIHPTAVVNPIVMSIPMPGHQVTDRELEQTKEDVARLENLIDEHDVVFLLMDTRESRWLPSIIALSKQKLVINAAIGFDTFLLQRYGIRDYSKPSLESDSVSSQDQGHFLESSKLGCYFCNDIVAPGDSTSDRTLDQQCTVSRPGVSMMVSALAVELLASILSSKYGSGTPAPLDMAKDSTASFDNEECSGDLGVVPHSIRGNLSRYHIYMPTSPAFNKCSACSKPVIETYMKEGFNFLRRVFEDPGYLEEVAGLKDLQNVDDNVWALDSDEELSKFEED